MASKSSRILIIGSTGHIGRYIAKASIAFGHPTFLLVRESTINSSEKAMLLRRINSGLSNKNRLDSTINSLKSEKAMLLESMQVQTYST
jgi:NAD dependent epimerase/dehydratase family enzyme